MGERRSGGRGPCYRARGDRSVEECVVVRAVRFGVALAVLVAVLAAHVVAARALLHAYPYSWSWTELLVDYGGGFVKRGLLGEIAHRSQGAISAGRLVTDVLFAAYALTSVGLILVLRLTDEVPGALFLASPTGWMFPLLVPAAYGRKDAFVVGAVVASLIVVRRHRSGTAALAVAMAIFAVAGLLVEIAWFYFPLVFAAFLFRWRDEPLRWRLGACAVAGAYTLGCLLLTLGIPPVDTAEIAASWPGSAYVTAETGALCCLNMTVADAVAVARATWPNLGGYALAAGFGLVPHALLLAKRPLRHGDALAFCALGSAALAALFPLVVTADWGRYLYLGLTALFLSLWVAGRTGPEPAAAAPADAYGFLLRAALLLVYATTWQTVHYQFTDRSAFIPGALFRALGSTGITPPRD